MKTEDEIQRAHDLLCGIVLGEAPAVGDDKSIIAALDVLCWVLDHDHNTTFSRNIEALEAELLRRGVVPTRRNN